MTMQRDLQDEIMDDPELDEGQHIHALQGLARLNWWSASGQILWRPIARLAKQNSVDSLRVLDVATGGGDLPIWLYHKSKQAGLKLDLTGLDISQRAVDYSAELAAAAQAKVRFEQRNALAEPLPDGYDVIVSSLFLHHLREEESIHLIRSMAASTENIFLVNDLLRHRRAWMLAGVASRTFTRSEVVHSDAVQSVKAAFSWQEIHEIARQTEVPSISIKRRWPFRFLMEGTRYLETSSVDSP